MVAPDWLVPLVSEVPDFPQPGILFRDLSPLWASSSGTSRAAMALAADPGALAERRARYLQSFIDLSPEAWAHDTAVWIAR